MAIEILRRLGLMAVFVLIQALVLNRIHLFDCASLLLYVYFVLLYPANMPKWLGLILAFLLGVLIDAFSNTAGVASASLTLIAFIQPYFLQLFLSKDSEPDFTPGIATMGWLKYSTYAITLIFTYCLAYFSLEAFSFHHWLQWLIATGASMALSSLFIITLNSTRR